MKKRLLLFFLLVLPIFFSCANSESSVLPRGETFKKEYRVMPIYFYPADLAPNSLYLDAINKSLAVIQAWYSVQLDGLTFELDSAITVRGNHDLSWYQDPEKVLEDLSSFGLKPKPQILLIFIEGSGIRGIGHTLNFWAVLGERTLAGISGEYPADKLGFSKNSQRGAIAHELGHAFGLPHPEANEENKDSVMLSWAFFPKLILLDSEIEFLRNSPFFK